MRSETEIRQDFRASIKKAEELESVAEQLRSFANNSWEQSLGELAAAWQGEAASAFLVKGSNYQDRVLKCAKNLKEIAGGIRTMAQNTYNAEMRALEIARERLYNLTNPLGGH